MTRRLFLWNWTVQPPSEYCRHYRWLFVLAMATSILVFFGKSSSPVQAQSGITSPASGSAVTGDVVIFGTAVIDPFQKYELHYKLEPSTDDAYIYFDGNTMQVTNGQLGILRAAGFAPGRYSIRLRVVKTDGNYAEFYARDLSVNQGPAEPTPLVTITPTLSSGVPTETPIPTATFTPAPQPTPIVGQVIQPQLEGEAPIPTATATGEALAAPPANPPSDSSGAADGASGDNTNTLFAAPQNAAPVEVTNSFTRDLGEAVAVDRLRNFFFTGIRLSATLILGAIVLLAGKRLFGWFWTQYR